MAQIGGLSGHAGQSFLVHGEDRPAEIQRGKLQEAGLEKIYYPYLRQSMDLTP